MARVTWSEPDGSWGIKGVDLREIFNPRVYCALVKLKEVENLIDTINSPGAIPRELAIRELLTMGSDQTGGDGDGSHMDL